MKKAKVDGLRKGEAAFELADGTLVVARVTRRENEEGGCTHLKGVLYRCDKDGRALDLHGNEAVADVVCCEDGGSAPGRVADRLIDDETTPWVERNRADLVRNREAIKPAALRLADDDNEPEFRRETVPSLDVDESRHVVVDRSMPLMTSRVHTVMWDGLERGVTDLANERGRLVEALATRFERLKVAREGFETIPEEE